MYIYIKGRAWFQQHRYASCHQVFSPCKAKRQRKFTPVWEKYYILSSLVGLRTYQLSSILCLGLEEILYLHLRYKFGCARSTRQQQEDCVIQQSSVSAHCFCVCLCCCWVNVKVLSYGFCERVNLPVGTTRSVLVPTHIVKRRKTHNAFSKASNWTVCPRLSSSYLMSGACYIRNWRLNGKWFASSVLCCFADRA
jgi:hypothetical protein